MTEADAFMAITEAEETVDHPGHYTALPVEPIELARVCDFCTGNVLKYILRAPFKGTALEDMKKALWYLRYLQAHPEMYRMLEPYGIDETTAGDIGEKIAIVEEDGLWEAWGSAYACTLGDVAIVYRGSAKVTEFCQRVVVSLLDMRQEPGAGYDLSMKLRSDTFRVLGTMLEAVVWLMDNDLKIKQKAVIPGTVWNRKLALALGGIEVEGGGDASE